MPDMIATDVAIIGAGPRACSPRSSAGLLKLGSVLIDALDEVGGQCTALYPEKPIYDIPAHPAIAAGDLIGQLEQQIAPFAPPRLLGRRVERLEGECGRFVLETSRGDQIQAKAVLLAAGAGAFGPKPPAAGRVGRVRGVRRGAVLRAPARGLSRPARGDRRRRRQRGGLGAVAEGCRGEGLRRASPAQVPRRARKRRPARRRRGAGRDRDGHPLPAPRAARHGRRAAQRPRSPTWTAPPGTCRRTGCLPFFGLSMELGPIAEWGLDLDRHHIQVTPSTCETSRRGVFAIGDVATYPGKLKLILQGFSEAAMAAHAIHPIVHPGEALHFEYSTSKGVPGA